MPPQRIGEVLESVLEAMENSWIAGDKGHLRSGVGAFDFYELLKPRTVLAVVGPPGSGKTRWASGMATLNASDGTPTLYLSFESDTHELARRTLAAVACVEPVSVRQLRREHWAQLHQAACSMRGWPLCIEGMGAVDADGLVRRAGEWARSQTSPGLVIVDYVQLLAGAGDQATRNDELARATRGFKHLALDAGVAVVLLSQVNRMGGTRDCGAIEEDADAVVAMRILKWPDQSELVLKKNRRGREFTVNAEWCSEERRFMDPRSGFDQPLPPDSKSHAEPPAAASVYSQPVTA